MLDELPLLIWGSKVGYGSPLAVLPGYLQQKIILAEPSEIDCQKQLIKTFLNSVFAYVDQVVLTFHRSSDNRIRA